MLFTEPAKKLDYGVKKLMFGSGDVVTTSQLPPLMACGVTFINILQLATNWNTPLNKLFLVLL